MKTSLTQKARDGSELADAQQFYTLQGKRVTGRMKSPGILILKSYQRYDIVSMDKVRPVVHNCVNRLIP